MSNTITGNLTADPQLRQLDSGDHVANLSIASNRRKKNPTTNEWEDHLDGYFDVIVWRDHARNAAESLSKGDRVIVVGRLTTRTWTTDTGDTRYKTEIEADEIGPSLRWAWATPAKPTTAATPDQHSTASAPVGSGTPF